MGEIPFFEGPLLNSKVPSKAYATASSYKNQ